MSVPAARQRLEAHVRTWARDPGVNAANVANNYADRVIYYGKRMSRPEVLNDKLQYVAVWPQRRYHSYHIVPGTVTTWCDRRDCRLSGVMQWHRRSRTGQVSIGSARLILVL